MVILKRQHTYGTELKDRYPLTINKNLNNNYLLGTMKFSKQLSILLVIFSSVFTFAQVKFEAKVSKTKLGVNERLRVDFEMNQNGDNFSPPEFSNFTIVGGPNQSVSNSWINGVRSFSKTYSYFLAPKKQGRFPIGQATIEIEGETYKTSPVMVEITGAVSRPNDPNNVEQVLSENIHLVAEISKTNPYLNEAVTVVYKLYVSPETGVSNWREISSPRYNDFWSQNIDLKAMKVENGSYKGKDYRFVILRKTVLYPQKTGTLEIEPLSLDITVDVPTNRRDFFGGRLMTQTQKTVSAGSKTIRVKPLPTEGKPTDFSGAVGQFKFKLSSSKTQLNASESLQARVEVSGNGNLKLFQLPVLNLPSSLEVYEPEYIEKINTNAEGMTGTISNNYTVVPQYKGNYPIPSISFSYFDLKSETYKTINSSELVISVEEGPHNTNNADNSLTSVASDKQNVIASVDQFVFIKSDTSLEPIHREHFFKSSWFWSSLILPFLAIPLALVARRRKAVLAADVTGNKLRKADKLARRYLSDAQKNLDQKDAFYISLERALHNYLKAKLNIETSDMSKDRIKHLLSEKSVDVQSISEFIMLLDNCELARYTPFTGVKIQQDYDCAAQVISSLDRQIR